MSKKNVFQNEGIKSITITMSVTVQVSEGSNDKELLAAAEKKVVEQIQEKFPTRYTYAITDGITIPANEATGGKAVFIPDLKVNGIIYGHNPSSVAVVTTGNRRLNCKLSGLTESKAMLDELVALGRRPDWLKPEWGEGYTGYLRVKPGEYVPVIVGKKKGQKTPVYPINGGKTCYQLTDVQMAGSMSDELPTNGGAAK
ncbi:hypothetical protein [Paenibacillus sp. Y412MC10]|uniref:hypothetical protein n=1 Tax=Geobacillus sp. (strain Y412MC10) TaxID=481743 RepID=UPI0011AB531D|nr:hypothetical protein [Paenibacillus sp. Y412MC10]